MDTTGILEQARAVLERESASVAALTQQLDESFAEVVRLLLACEGHVLVGGSGTSNAIALRFAHLLSCCGTPALFIHPGDAQHGAAGAVTARDVVIAISKGGRTAEVNALARIAKERGAKLVAFTEKPESELGQMADAVLQVVAQPGVDPYGMIATGSSLTNAAMCDALCVTLLELRGYSEADFSQTHPGGAVGHLIEERKGATP
ncbi:MAG: SIS domain-containing protein [Anaerolineae bacterium]|nr:SIS domain-containing protein [Anaerolineae bacterium]